MRTTGSVLRQARKASGRSLTEVSRETKIKEKFLVALEKNDFSSLPSFPTVLGFARSYAEAVYADSEMISALLRRDFPRSKSPKKQKEMSLAPEPFWTPKTTIFATAAGTALILGVYLARQYFLFAGPPPLEIAKIDAENGKIDVLGKTAPSATVEVNGNRVLVSEDGTFTFESITPESGSLEVRAVSRTGKETTIVKNITPP